MCTGPFRDGGFKRTNWKWIVSLVFFVGVADAIAAGGSLVKQAATTLTLPENPSPFPYTLVNAFPELEFKDPVCVVSPPGENNKLFVVQQDGRIILINNLSSPTRTVFLDISDRIDFGSPEGEGGTLGLAFHPNYAQNGFFFVYYLCNTSTADGSGRHDRLSRFTRSRNDAGHADASSEVVLFTQYDQEFNHNGGSLLFGPDGYLYITLGDEGYPEDPFDNAQRIDKNFFSGVFRIDVDHKPGSLPPNPHTALGGKVNYWVPPDNPYVGATSFNGKPVDPTKVRTEFYAVGLRSPWRMFLDQPTGNLYVSDVGEVGNNPANRSEEINLIVKGGNYGWPYYESDQAGPKINQMPAGFSAIGPLITYERGNSGPFVGRAAIGGVVYRGSTMPELNGAYIFGDYFSGNIWALRHSGFSVQSWNFLMAQSQGHIASFGLDPSNGDVLVCDVIDDQVKRFVPVPPAELPPPTLAATGAFSDVPNLIPNPGIIPYDINVPFWSDGALKRRWFALRDGNARISSGGASGWNSPMGTVWIKHFDLEMVEGDPSTARRVETRFLIRTPDGVAGLTYRWNDAQDNASLVGAEGADQNFTINDHGTPRVQTWHFPGRNECASCHTAVAGYSLGFTPAQMNRTVDYGRGPERQIQALQRAGYLKGSGGGRAMVAPNNTKATLEARVRSYLAANCAQCHQPGGPARANWDARLTTATARAGIVNGALVDNLGNPANRVVAPGSPEHSVLLQRLSTTDPRLRMPPIASSVVDEESVALVSQWISSLRARHQPLAVKVTSPRGMRATAETITLRGTATGDDLDRIVYSLNGGPEQDVSGASRWSSDITLSPGKNTLVITAIDSFGERSRSVKRTFVLKP